MKSKDLISGLLSNPMNPEHFLSLSTAWKNGQLMPLAGNSNPIERMEMFTKGLEYNDIHDEDFQVYSAKGLFNHLIEAVDPGSVDTDRASLWVKRAAMAMQPDMVKSLLTHLPGVMASSSKWMGGVVKTDHPQAPIVLRVLLECNQLDADQVNDLLVECRTASTARLLIEFGADPSASNALDAWMGVAGSDIDLFNGKELVEMAQLAWGSSTPAEQQLADLARMAPAIGINLLKKSIKSRNLDPASALPDGRTLPEHLCINGMKQLFGYVSGSSYAWESQAVDQAKMITWALSALPADYPRTEQARAAALLAHATMKKCPSRNYGTLLESVALGRLGAVVGMGSGSIKPPSAPVVHEWLIQVVNDGLLDNGSTVASSLLAQPPSKQWLEEDCGIETAAMAFMRCAGRHAWDPRWQSPAAKSRLIVPQYDRLTDIHPTLQASPHLLKSPSPLLVLASMVGPNANGHRECKALVESDISLARVDMNDPDAAAFLAYVHQHLAPAHPWIVPALAANQAAQMENAVAQPRPGSPKAAPRL